MFGRLAELQQVRCCRLGPASPPNHQPCLPPVAALAVICPASLPLSDGPPTPHPNPPHHPPVQKLRLMTKKDMILAVRLMADEPEEKAAQQQVGADSWVGGWVAALHLPRDLGFRDLGFMFRV